jgi:hypothetical protein
MDRHIVDHLGGLWSLECRSFAFVHVDLPRVLLSASTRDSKWSDLQNRHPLIRPHPRTFPRVLLRRRLGLILLLTRHRVVGLLRLVPAQALYMFPPAPRARIPSLQDHHLSFRIPPALLNLHPSQFLNARRPIPMDLSNRTRIPSRPPLYHQTMITIRLTLPPEKILLPAMNRFHYRPRLRIRFLRKKKKRIQSLLVRPK